MALNQEEKLARVTAMVEQAEAAGLIYNVDWQAAKDWLNRYIEEGYKEANKTPEAVRAYRQDHYSWKDPESDWKWPITSTVAGVRKVIAKDLKREWPAAVKPLVIAKLHEADRFLADVQPLADRLMALKPKIVKGKKPSENPRQTPERTVENTGTCAVCGQNVKMERGTKLYHHGFQIQYSQRMGTCPGVGCDPIEISTEGLVKYLKTLGGMLGARQRSLKDLPNATTLPYGYGARAKKLEKDTANPHEWDQAYRNAQFTLESEINGLFSAIARTKQRLEEWKPEPLPEEQAKLAMKR